MFSTSGGVQYIGGYHHYVGGYHHYVGGYHEYIGMYVHMYPILNKGQAFRQLLQDWIPVIGVAGDRIEPPQLHEPLNLFSGTCVINYLLTIKKNQLEIEVINLKLHL